MSAGKSVKWVIGAVMILIALFGWGYMAGVYATNVEQFHADLPRRTSYRGYQARVTRAVDSGMWHFVSNGLRQIPNAPEVISYNFAKQIWLPITIGLLELAAVGGGFGMKRLEQSLNAPPRRRR